MECSPSALLFTISAKVASILHSEKTGVSERIAPFVMTTAAEEYSRLSEKTWRAKMSSAKESSVYKVIEIVGVSSESWEAATKAAVLRASKTLRDLRIAEVVKLDVAIEDGKVAKYRARLSVSFKYEGED